MNIKVYIKFLICTDIIISKFQEVQVENCSSIELNLEMIVPILKISDGNVIASNNKTWDNYEL